MKLLLTSRFLWNCLHEGTGTFQDFVVFLFESICVQDEIFKNTGTTKWIGKHIPISVSNSSKLVEQPIFPCNAIPHYVFASFITVLEKWASQSKVQRKNMFFDIKTAEKIERKQNWKLSANVIADGEESMTLKMFAFKKVVMTAAPLLSSSNAIKQPIDQQNIWNSTVTCCLSLVLTLQNLTSNWSYLLPILINGPKIETVVIKKTNQNTFFIFGDFQLLDIMNFHGGPTSLGSFSKAHTTSETKGFFPYEWFN